MSQSKVYFKNLQRSFKNQENPGKWSIQGNNVFITNISLFTTEEKLKQKFQQFGKVLSINIVRDSETQSSKRYGFVLFESALDAYDAIRYLNGKLIDGRKIHLEAAKACKEFKKFFKQQNPLKNVSTKENNLTRRSPSPLKYKKQKQDDNKSKQVVHKDIQQRKAKEDYMCISTSLQNEAHLECKQNLNQQSFNQEAKNEQSIDSVQRPRNENQQNPLVQY